MTVTQASVTGYQNHDEDLEDTDNITGYIWYTSSDQVLGIKYKPLHEQLDIHP